MILHQTSAVPNMIHVRILWGVARNLLDQTEGNHV
jgi:hypothetical protein